VRIIEANPDGGAGGTVVTVTDKRSRISCWENGLDSEAKTRYLETTIGWMAAQQGHIANLVAEIREAKRDLVFFRSLMEEVEKEGKKGEETAKECMVCLDEAKLLSFTPCGHYCCTECLARWLAENGTCPVCRAAIKREDIMKVDIGGLAKKAQHSIDPLVDT
jgi:hypothetical protein